MCELLGAMHEEWGELDVRIAALDREFVETARASAPARRLATIPGIGALKATALTAAVGEVEDFASARDLAAWLGLVPRQTTTGGKARLGGITKRGQVCLRTLLIHGARAALPGLQPRNRRRIRWRRLRRQHPGNQLADGAGHTMFEGRLLPGRCRSRMLRPRPLDRPVDRPERFPAALLDDAGQPERGRHLRRHRLEHAADAHRALESRQTTGATVLVL
jgi:hypothetical protein